MFYVIITNDKELVKKAREHGAGVFKAEKFPEDLELAGNKEVDNVSMNVYDLLRELNVKTRNLGYHYLKFVMEKCAANREYYKKGATKEIYPECAEHFDTTPSRAERAIRHALDLSFQSVPEKFSEIFGGTFAKVPTNSEFIALVCEYFAMSK